MLLILHISNMFCNFIATQVLLNLDIWKKTQIELDKGETYTTTVIL